MGFLLFLESKTSKPVNTAVAEGITPSGRSKDTRPDPDPGQWLRLGHTDAWYHVHSLLWEAW